MSKNGLSSLRGGSQNDGLMHRLTIGAYFGAWYALNVMYNSRYSFIPRGERCLGNFAHSFFINI